ncbi:hypothetical protein [Thalassotalea atypica]|uniref:hypothetical protein n=1 Tax=Thalassotalea atypica TaxID=2054316 RepID=UPI00257359B9|nr:hypothetical protein [Thalassotalea atypica]
MEMGRDHTLKYLLWETKKPQRTLEQYYINLEVKFYSHSVTKEAQNNVVFDKIHELLKEQKHSWHSAYKIEQYLAKICDEQTLNSDLNLTLVSVKHHLSANKFNAYKKEVDQCHRDNIVEHRRIILQKMLSELHSFFINRSESYEYGLLIRVRLAFILSIGLFCFVMSLVYTSYIHHILTAGEMLIIACASGFLGAGFSMIARLKGQLSQSSMEQLKTMHCNIYLIKRLSLGTTAALVVYFLIQSGFLGQLINPDLLPKLPINYLPSIVSEHTNTFNETVKEVYLNVSVLIVWSFVAGFSEMLVPNLISKVEKRFSTSN